MAPASVHFVTRKAIVRRNGPVFHKIWAGVLLNPRDVGALAAKERGAERIIAMSSHKTRQDLAKEFGATDIVVERGDAGIEQESGTAIACAAGNATGLA